MSGSVRTPINSGTKRDGTFGYLSSTISDRVPLANADDMVPNNPVNLTLRYPPGSRQEGSFIYNTNNDSLYVRSKALGSPVWQLIGGAGSSGASNNAPFLVWDTDMTGLTNERLATAGNGFDIDNMTPGISTFSVQLSSLGGGQPLLASGHELYTVTGVNGTTVTLNANVLEIDGGGGGGGESLAQTLVIGNDTGGTNLRLSTGDVITDTNFGGGIRINPQPGPGQGILTTTSIFAGLTDDKPLIRTTAVNSALQDVNFLLTATEVLQGIYDRSGTAAIQAQFPTGANLVAAIDQAANGFTFDFTFSNAGTDTVTMTTNTDVTLNGSMVIEASSAATFKIRVDNAGANTYSVYRGDFIASASGGDLNATLLSGNQTGASGSSLLTNPTDIAISVGDSISDATLEGGVRISTLPALDNDTVGTGDISIVTGSNIQSLGPTGVDTGSLLLMTGDCNRSTCNSGNVQIHSGEAGNSTNASEKSGDVFLYSGAVNNPGLGGTGFLDIRTGRSSNASNSNVGGGFGNLVIASGVPYTFSGTVPNPVSNIANSTALTDGTFRSSIAIQSGDAIGSNANAGLIQVVTGNSNNTRRAGDFTLTTGNAGATNANLSAGNVEILTGSGGTNTSSPSGSITLSTGGSTGSGVGGITLSTGTGSGGERGDILLSCRKADGAYDNNAPAAVVANGSNGTISTDFSVANLAAGTSVTITVLNGTATTNSMILLTNEGILSATDNIPAIVSLESSPAVATFVIRIYNNSGTNGISSIGGGINFLIID